MNNEMEYFNWKAEREREQEELAEEEMKYRNWEAERVQEERVAEEEEMNSAPPEEE